MSLTGYLHNGMNQSLNGILTISDGLGSTIENGKIICTHLNANGTITATDISSNTINGINTLNIPDKTGTNTWTGINTFNILPTSTQSPTSQYQLVNKKYTDEKFGGIGFNNIWTGTNTFNILPTSTITPTTIYQLVNKTYVDSNFGQLAIDNLWTGTNTFKYSIVLFNGKSFTMNTGSYLKANGLNVSDTKISYLSNLTGDVQTQINSANNIINTLNDWTLQNNFNGSASVSGSLYFGSSSGYNEIKYNSTNNGVDISSYIKGRLINVNGDVPQLIWTDTGVSCPNTLTTNDLYNSYIFTSKLNSTRVPTTAYLTSYYQPISSMSSYPTKAGNNTFTGSNDFTNSNSFTGSNDFTNSNSFTGLNTFTNSNSFTGSNTFTNSNSFTGSNNFTGSNTFTNSIFLDDTNLNTNIFSFYSNIDIYGSAGVNLMTGGTTGWGGQTNLLSLSPTLCNIDSALTSGGSITGSNSIITPYVKTYNNLAPEFSTTYALNTPFLGITFTKALPNRTGTTITTSSTLYTGFIIPANYNQALTISTPVSTGINATGTFTATSASSILITNTLSLYKYLIYQNDVLYQTITATIASGGVSVSTVGINIASALSGQYSYQVFMGNFKASFTPPLLDTSETYTIFFQTKITTTTSGSTPITAYQGQPNLKVNSSNFTSSSLLSNCTINYGTVGTGGVAISLVSVDNLVSTTGTSYVNNLTIANPPSLSYTVLPTSLSSNQIGYSVPVTYTTIGTALANETFTILATSASLPIGNYNVYWTTHANFTGSTGNITVGQYGVVYSNTVPIGLTGSSFIENHNQTAYYLHNQSYTSSAYVSPTAIGYKMYLGIWASFSTVTITPTTQSNLQVIRTS